MFSPAALLLIPLGYLYLWPLVARWLTPADDLSPLEVALTAIALGLGSLALILFWVGMLPGAWITPFVVLLIVVSGAAVGLIRHPAWVNPSRWRAYWVTQWRRLSALDIDSLLMWIVIGSLWIMMIHSLYFPFVADDTLSRYGLQAKQIYLAHRIPAEVWGYPPLMPLSFASTWFAAGSINEHLARVFSVMMAFGLLGSTFAIGRRAGGTRVGLLAAAIMAVTTVFVRNTTQDYSDIPTAFPATLAILYVLRWWQAGHLRDALLAGVLTAFAIFTKQSALTWLASLSAVPVLWLISSRTESVAGRWRRAFTGWAAMFLPSVLIAAPWYVRNALLHTIINTIPVAGLYHVLGPKTGALGLIPMIPWAVDFNPWLVPIYGAGWVVGLFRAIREGINALVARIHDLPIHLILGLIAVPYWLVWWSRFSFEARFLVEVLPVMAVWAAVLFDWLARWISQRVKIPPFLLRAATAVMLFGLLFVAAEDRLGGIYYALTRPFATEEERILQVKPGVYLLAQYIRSHMDPVNDHLMVMDGRLLYYLPEYDLTVQYPLTLADLAGYDYLVHSSSIFSVYGRRLGWNRSQFFRHVWDTRIFETVYEVEGVHIMRILRTDIPPKQEP